MKSLKSAVALVALGLAGQASADTLYGYCQVQAAPIPSQQRGFRYKSGIIELPSGTDSDDLRDSDFASAFASYVSSIYPGDRVARPACSVFGTLLEARQSESMEPSSELYVHTGWLGGRGEAVDRGPKVTPKSEEVELAFPARGGAPAAEGAVSHKKTNAEADAEYAAKLQQYNREMDAWRDKVADREREEAERKRQLAESAEKARKAKAEWEARVAACKAGDWSQCGVTPQ